MAKAAKKSDIKKPSKPRKIRSEPYDKPLKIKGTFEDLVMELITPMPTVKKTDTTK